LAQGTVFLAWWKISLEKAKWLTLLGVSLAVISSTALHINCGLFVLLGAPG
jgi:hypothetical protein